MKGQPALHLVDPVGLQDYPIARGERLDGNSFVKWQYHRWLASSMYLKGSHEAKSMARDLFDMSQTQSPIGTLPDDMESLALMLRVDLRRFEDLCRSDYGPLHNWVRCLADGEVRLMHPIVLEQVQDALDRREMHNLSKQDKAEYQRIKRLRERLGGMKFPKEALNDRVLIGRMEAWLKANWRGNREQPAYDKVVAVAASEGWFNASKPLI